MALIITDVDTLAGREYYGMYTGEFDSATQEVGAIKSPALSKLSSIKWSLDTTGHITLKWKGSGGPDIVIAHLANTGSWEFGRGAIAKPTLSTGEVILTSVGFVATDTYTILMNGAVL